MSIKPKILGISYLLFRHLICHYLLLLSEWETRTSIKWTSWTQTKAFWLTMGELRNAILYRRVHHQLYYLTIFSVTNISKLFTSFSLFHFAIFSARYPPLMALPVKYPRPPINPMCKAYWPRRYWPRFPTRWPPTSNPKASHRCHAPLLKLQTLHILLHNSSPQCRKVTLLRGLVIQAESIQICKPLITPLEWRTSISACKTPWICSRALRQCSDIL